MTVPVLLMTALLSGIGAVTLTGWIRPMMADRSSWLQTRPHAVLAVLGGAGAAALEDYFLFYAGNVFSCCYDGVVVYG